MAELYLHIDPDEQREVLSFAAQQLDRPENVLEKDIWLCWVLQTLFDMPNAHPMAFKGGTSLSKVYDIIHRFSEDVDITLDYRHFNDDFDPFVSGVSNSQVKKFSDRLKGYVHEYANSLIVPYLQSQLNKLPSADQYRIRVDESGEKIWISYPSVVEQNDEYLKTEILLELGGRNIIDPNEKHIVQPYTADVVPSLIFPEGEVIVLSPERTFWEKATLIHVECQRGLRVGADRLSRHWYDLVKLASHDSGQRAILNHDLFKDVVKHKSVFFNTSYANYDQCLEGKLVLIPNADSLSALKKDYQQMIVSGMLHGTILDFDNMIDLIRNIEKNINVK